MTADNHGARVAFAPLENQKCKACGQMVEQDEISMTAHLSRCAKASEEERDRARKAFIGCQTNLDLTGKQFGKWTILGLVEQEHQRHGGRFWYAQCACDRIVRLRTSTLLLHEKQHCEACEKRHQRAGEGKRATAADLVQKELQEAPLELDELRHLTGVRMGTLRGTLRVLIEQGKVQKLGGRYALC